MQRERIGLSESRRSLKRLLVSLPAIPPLLLGSSPGMSPCCHSAYHMSPPALTASGEEPLTSHPALPSETSPPTTVPSASLHWSVGCHSVPSGYTYMKEQPSARSRIWYS